MNFDESFLTLLQNLNFKQKDEKVFYYITPLTLKQTSTLLVIYCFAKDGKIFLCDNAQIIDAYDATNIDFENLKNEIANLAKKFNIEYRKTCLLKTINPNNFVNELSEFVKAIIFIEQNLETYL